jgi:histidyl-tRNA synthetase
MKELKIAKGEKKGLDLFITPLGERAKDQVFLLLKKVRDKGIRADMDYFGKSLRAQLKTADRLGASFVYIVGEEELEKGKGILRNMKTGEQKEVAFEELGEEVRP